MRGKKRPAAEGAATIRGPRAAGIPAIALLLFGSSWPGAAPLAQEAAYAPEEVKAAFLYHFGAFVEWPAEVGPGEGITIAVIGAPEVAAELERILPGREVQGRPATVRRLESIDEIEDAQILFIGQDEEDSLPELLEPIRGRPVLTVTESEGGLDNGAIINFALVDRRVRFEVSLNAAEAAGLELSSRLLAVALRVEQSSGLQRSTHGVQAAVEGRPETST